MPTREELLRGTAPSAPAKTSFTRNELLDVSRPLGTVATPPPPKKSALGTVVGGLQAVGGALGSVGEAIAAPFIKTGATAVRAGRGLFNIATGNIEAEQRAQAWENRALGAQHRPVETVREAIGTGLQVGSTVAGAAVPGAAQLSSSVLGAAARGTALGAVSGAQYGFGRGLSMSAAEGEGVGQSLRQASVEGVVGGVVGGIMGGVTSGVTKALGNWQVRQAEGFKSKAAEAKASQAALGSFRKSAKTAIEESRAVSGINKKISIADTLRKADDELLAQMEDAKAKMLAQMEDAKAVEQAARKVSADMEAANRAKFTVRDTELVVGADAQSRAVFRQMLDNADDAAASARYPVEQTPKGLAGQTLLGKAEKAMELRQAAGQRIGSVVESRATVPVNVSKAIYAFDVDLLKNGASFLDDGSIDFSKSVWKSDGGAQKALNGVRESLIDSVDVGSAHLQKRVINETADLLGQQKLLTGSTERIMSRAKQALVESIDSAAPGYREAAREYAKHSFALTEFERLMGRKFSGADEISQAIRAGEVAARLQSNASGNALVAINALDDSTGNFGGSLKDQVAFAGLVEDLWKLKAERSLESQVAKAGVEAAAALKSGSPMSAFSALRSLFSSDQADDALSKAALRRLVEDTSFGSSLPSALVPKAPPRP